MYKGVILALDFGMRYIGVATGQTITNSATPLTTIEAKDGLPDWESLDSIIAKWRPVAVIIGYPLNMDDSKQDLTLLVEEFAATVAKRYALPIELTDERLSSWEVKQELKLNSVQHHNYSKEQIKVINAKAAAVILTQWLREKARNIE